MRDKITQILAELNCILSTTELTPQQIGSKLNNPPIENPALYFTIEDKISELVKRTMSGSDLVDTFYDLICHISDETEAEDSVILLKTAVEHSKRAYLSELCAGPGSIKDSEEQAELRLEIASSEASHFPNLFKRQVIYHHLLAEMKKITPLN